jgi:hypothetical protein
MASSEGKSKTGGATFWPRLPDGQRPVYPPTARVLTDAAVDHVRTALLCMLLAYCGRPLYDAALELLQDPKGFALDDRGAFCVLLTAVHTLTYVGVCGGIELLVRSGVWARYKYRRPASQQPSRALVVQTLVTAAVSQLLLTPALLWYYGYDAFKAFGMPEMRAPLPPALDLFRHFLVVQVFNDWGFYWAHRTMHSKPLYALLHKQHHSYTGTIGIAAEFSGTVEVRRRTSTDERVAVCLHLHTLARLVVLMGCEVCMPGWCMSSGQISKE